MNYLLDTHALLWFLFLPEKLSAATKKILTDSNHEIYISVISFWEISLKHSLGKLELIKIKSEEIPVACKKSGFKIVPLTEAEAISFYQLPRVIHKDPFDRMLAWQAIQKQFILITNDESVAQYEKFDLKIFY